MKDFLIDTSLKNDYIKRIKKLGKQAYEYFNRETRLIPTSEDIVDYVADRIEDELGHMDEAGYKQIAKILKIKL